MGHKVCLLSLLTVLFVLGTSPLHAQQVIYVRVADFVPGMSEFEENVAGNEWVETEEEGALFGTAYGGPGDNNRDPAGPSLVIRLTVPVKQGESTADGMDWVAWARMYEPGALETGNLNNSIFFRTSADGENWIPNDRGTNDLLWNDPGGAKNDLLFPESINGVDSIFTDVGEELPWFWQNHKATIDVPRAPDSAIDPVLAVGDNYVELVPRESDPVDYPRIEIICFRNDGQQPSDTEALAFYDSLAVQSEGKLAVQWGKLRSD